MTFFLTIWCAAFAGYDFYQYNRTGSALYLVFGMIMCFLWGLSVVKLFDE